MTARLAFGQPSISCQIVVHKLPDGCQSALHNNELCKEFQLNLRAYHSTETALVKVTHDRLLASAKGLVSVLVLLDLRLL